VGRFIRPKVSSDQARDAEGCSEVFADRRVVSHSDLEAASSRVARRRSHVDVAVEFAGRSRSLVDAIIAAVEEMNAV